MTGNVPLAARRRQLPGSVTGSLSGPLLVLPCVLLLVAFVYRPVLRSLQLSLYATNLLGEPTRFIGLRNYAQLLTDPQLRQVVLTTLAITALSTAMAMGGALAAALPLLRATPRAGSVLSVVLSLPFAYSTAAASAAFAGLLAPSVGTLNEVLAHVGIEGPGWLQSRGWALLSISAATAWYEFGFAFLVLLAALSQLDPSILEAAALDGAGEWRAAWSVIVPTIRPTLLFLLVTQTVSGLQMFTQVQVLTRGGPAGSTRTVVYELYQRAFGAALPEYGRASTVALLLLVLVALVTAVQFRLAREA